LERGSRLALARTGDGMLHYLLETETRVKEVRGMGGSWSSKFEKVSMKEDEGERLGVTR